MKPRHSSCERTSLPPSKLVVLHNDSRPTFKPKPKIRIIHIVAPEIIRTDVENFRELVQRLTGKPAESWKGNKKKTKEITTDTVSSHEMLPPNVYTSKTSKFVGGSSRIMKKESEEIINESENPNAFLNFLDVDSFIHDMNEYPLLPHFRSSQISSSTYGEVHLC